MKAQEREVAERRNALEMVLRETLKGYGIYVVGYQKHSDKKMVAVSIDKDMPIDNFRIIKNLYRFDLYRDVSIVLDGFDNHSYEFKYDDDDNSCMLIKARFGYVLSQAKYFDFQEMITDYRENILPNEL